MCTSTLLLALTFKLLPEPWKLGNERRFKRFEGWAWVEVGLNPIQVYVLILHLFVIFPRPRL
jgi:hypothetical protein